jgi:hypothetical protein
MYFRPLGQYVDLGAGAYATKEVGILYINSITLLFRNLPQNVDREVRKAIKDVDLKLAIVNQHRFDEQVGQNFARGG